MAHASIVITLQDVVGAIILPSLATAADAARRTAVCTKKESQERNKMKKCNFEDYVCPILFTDAVERFGLTDKEIQSFCNKGCSPICGRELKEYLEKRDRQ